MSEYQKTRLNRRNRALSIIELLPADEWTGFDLISQKLGLGLRQTAYYLTVAKRMGLVERKRINCNGIRLYFWRSIVTPVCVDV